MVVVYLITTSSAIQKHASIQSQILNGRLVCHSFWQSVVCLDQWIWLWPLDGRSLLVQYDETSQHTVMLPMHHLEQLLMPGQSRVLLWHCFLFLALAAAAKCSWLLLLLKDCIPINCSPVNTADGMWQHQAAILPIWNCRSQTSWLFFTYFPPVLKQLGGYQSTVTQMWFNRRWWESTALLFKAVLLAVCSAIVHGINAWFSASAVKAKGCNWHFHKNGAEWSNNSNATPMGLQTPPLCLVHSNQWE